MQSTCDHIFVIRGERAKIYSVVKKIFLDNYEIAFTEKKIFIYEVKQSCITNYAIDFT